MESKVQYDHSHASYVLSLKVVVSICLMATQSSPPPSSVTTPADTTCAPQRQHQLRHGSGSLPSPHVEAHVSIASAEASDTMMACIVSCHLDKVINLSLL